MMAVIRMLFGGKSKKPPSRRPSDERARQLKANQADLAQSIMAVERKGYEIRQELAGGVLKIVSGDRN